MHGDRDQLYSMADRQRTEARLAWFSSRGEKSPRPALHRHCTSVCSRNALTSAYSSALAKSTAW